MIYILRAQNNKTRFFYVLYSDKTWVFNQSERAQGSIYVVIEDILVMQLSRVVFHGISQLSLVFCWYTCMQYFDEPVGRVKSQTTRKKICVGNIIFASKILFVANKVLIENDVFLVIRKFV